MRTNSKQGKASVSSVLIATFVETLIVYFHRSSYFWHHTVEIFSPISVLVSLEDFLLELCAFVVMLPRFDGLVGLFLWRKKTAVSRMRHCEWTVFFLYLFIIITIIIIIIIIIIIVIFWSTGKNESYLKHKTFSRKVSGKPLSMLSDSPPSAIVSLQNKATQNSIHGRP